MLPVLHLLGGWEESDREHHGLGFAPVPRQVLGGWPPQESCQDITKRDIFHYVYAVLHHPAYRERYAENLKRELPRIPLVSSRDAFQVLVEAGARLSKLHLEYESAPEFPLRRVEHAGVPWSYRVQKMKLARDKSSLQFNAAFSLSGIPAEPFEYRLGNRSALEWIIDQFQGKTDARSGLSSDPNRADDEEYVARLVRQVVWTSVETVKIVGAIGAVEL